MKNVSGFSTILDSEMEDEGSISLSSHKMKLNMVFSHSFNHFLLRNEDFVIFLHRLIALNKHKSYSSLGDLLVFQVG